jgi:hypothetical protein
MGGMIEMIIWKVLWFGRVRLRSCYNIWWRSQSRGGGWLLVRIIRNWGWL